MLRYMYIGHAIQFRVSEALNFKLNINRKQKQIFIDQTRMCFTLTPCGVCVLPSVVFAFRHPAIISIIVVYHCRVCAHVVWRILLFGFYLFGVNRYDTE